MGGLGNILLISVLIRAQDQASGMLRAIGIDTATMLGKMQVAALGIGIVLAGIGVASVKAATTFDQAMHKVYALTGISQQQMQSYEQSILAMAPALDQTPTALAQGLYYVISAGFQGSQALQILSYSAKAAAAGMTNMDLVADVVTSAMKAFATQGMTAGHAVDDIMAAVTYGKVQLHSLATGLAFVGAQAGVAGFSFDETTAAISNLSQMAGNSGSRRVMMDLGNLFRQLGARDITATLKGMPLVAKSFDLAKYAGLDFIDKIKYIAQASGLTMMSLNQMRVAAHGNVKEFEALALAHMTDSAQFLKLIGGAAAALPAFMLLEDNGKEYNAILAKMGGNGQETAAAFNKMRESAGQRWNMIEVALTTVATIIGLQILPFVEKLEITFYNVAQAVIAFMQTTSGMGALKGALLGIVVIVGVLLFAAFMAVVTGPAAAFIAAFFALAAAGAILGPMIEAVVAHFGGLSGIMAKLHPIIVQVQSALRGAANELRQVFSNPAIMNALRQLQSALPALIPWFKMLAIDVGIVLVVAFNLFVAVLDAIAGALPGIIQGLTGLVQIIGGIGRVIYDVFFNRSDLGAAFAQIWTGMKNVVGGALSEILGFLGGFIGHFLGLFGTNGNKVKAGFMADLGGIKNAIGDFFGGIGAWIGSKLGGAGSAIGNFFSGIGSFIQTRLADIRAVFQRALGLIVNLFSWLYNHNYYFHDLVNVIKTDLTNGSRLIHSIISDITNFIALEWKGLQIIAYVAWNLIKQNIVIPLLEAWGDIQIFIDTVVTVLRVGWAIIHTDVTNAWNKFLSVVQNAGNLIKTAVQASIITPIKNLINGLGPIALLAGKAMIQMFIDGMKSMFGALGNAAQGAVNTVKKWLGFHSPAPNVPESAFWGPSLIKMFAQGMLSQLPAVQAAVKQVIGVVGGGLGGAPGGLGGTVSGGGSAMAGQMVAGTISPTSTTITHNWSGAFPNAVNEQAIMRAIQKVQQQDIQRSKTPGYSASVRSTNIFFGDD